jgi:hypothetical protein
MVSAPFPDFEIVIEVSTGKDSSEGPGVSSSASTGSSSSGRTDSCSASRSEMEKIRRILRHGRKSQQVGSVAEVGEGGRGEE